MSEKFVIWKIREVAQKKGVKNAYQFHTRTGISHTRASKIWKGNAKLGATDLAIISAALECDPKDLIGYKNLKKKGKLK